jgi:hypothetical protein
LDHHQPDTQAAAVPCRGFDEKWEQTEVFARARGRPPRILKDIEDVMIEKLEKIEDLQGERLPMRWSCFTNQYERDGTEMAFTTTIQSLFGHFSLMARN